MNDLELAFAGFAHGIDLAGVRPDNAGNYRYYVQKWHGPPGGEETNEHPFGDPTKDITWWPTPPDCRSIMEAS